ncbi:MAG: alpha/beta hydrolase [Granulosicoccus sp.]|nr:alpha/beta hydrolase [Granulosicoccus sp.]
MLKFFVVLLAAYIALVMAMYLMQRSLLYLPARYDINAAALTAKDVRAWPDADNYSGYLLANPATGENTSTTTVIIFHGNAGSAIDRLYYRDALAFTGARVLLAEYPGYGRRSGHPTEDSLVNEARSTIAAMAAARPADKLFIIGESLGAGVAAAAVSDTKTAQHVDGIVLITPWDSLVKVAARHYWYLPVRWLLRERYDSIRNLAEYKGPKLLVIASHDTIIPANHAQALFASLPESKRRLVINGAGHNNWLGFVDESWWKSLWQYLIDNAAEQVRP